MIAAVVEPNAGRLGGAERSRRNWATFCFVVSVFLPKASFQVSENHSGIRLVVAVCDDC